jgi:hypothetical protein
MAASSVATTAARSCALAAIVCGKRDDESSSARKMARSNVRARSPTEYTPTATLTSGAPRNRPS